MNHCLFLKRHLRRAHALMHSPLRELSVALVDDARMSTLHQRFLGIRGPTDVLTFPLERDESGKTIGGEIVICVPEAKRRALERGHPVRRELLLYAIHGMLHLGGMDDTTASGFRTMHRLEDEILTRLGVGPVFAGPSRGRTARRARSK